MKIVAFGEILWDIIQGKAHLGGAPLNFAAHASQCGAKSYIVSRVGKDDFGIKALDKLDEILVNKNFVQIDDQHPTGTVDVFLRNGQPSYTIHADVAYDFISYDELPESFDQMDIDVFYFGTLAQRHSKARNTLYKILKNKTFEYTFYDVNLRKDCYSKEVVLKSLEYSDILKLNDEEVTVLSNYLFSKKLSIEEFMNSCHEKYGHEVIIVTAGGDGCYVFHKGKIENVPGVRVKVADTVGAGDSFSASFMYMYLETRDPMKAAYIGNQIGGYVASCKGAIPRYNEEIIEMLNKAVSQ